MSLDQIAVIGAGSWGTALAVVCERAGRQVSLWARNQDAARAMESSHINETYLPGVEIPRAVAITSDLAAAVSAADAVLLVVPAQSLRRVAFALAEVLADDVPVALCAKGIEVNTGRLMIEVASETLGGRPIAVLSGPSFAGETAAGQPTAVTLAASSIELARALTQAVATRTFRPYASDDPVGAEVGGAVKNVLAIACGIAAGRGFGDNTRAALITRGLAEITRFAVALGGRRDTMLGLSGIGDIMLTCSSEQSRNFSFGLRLGRGEAQGETLGTVLGASQSTIEGVFTAAAVVARAQEAGVDMPIATAVDAVLNRGAGLAGTIEDLLARPLAREV